MQIDATEQPTPRSAEWLAGWDAGRAQEFKLASVVTRQRSEIDTLRAALADAERAQLERDCALLCEGCADKETGIISGKAELCSDNMWRHSRTLRATGELYYPERCSARHLRRAFAALHPEPEGKAK